MSSSVTPTELKNVETCTPGRKVFAVFLVVVSLWFSIGWLCSMYFRIDLTARETPAWEIDVQRKAIERRLSMGEDELLVMLIPEGTLFCNSLYGLALINIAQQRRADDAFRRETTEKLEWILGRVERLSKRYPFNLNDKLSPRGGIILAGHTNLLRAGYTKLGGTNPTILEDFRRESKVIYESFLAAKTGFPECYDGFTWAQDSVYALESLRLSDEINGTQYGAAIEKWVRSIKTHVDPVTGVMVAQVNPVSNESIEGSRGCAAAWGLVYMPNLDGAFSTEQYKRFHSPDWFVRFLGCYGVNEWYQGKNMPTNFHAGPVVFGLGMAASGISIGASRANGDLRSSNRLLRSLEFFGAPTVTFSGEKNYFLGACLLADVVALWGRTAPVGEQTTSAGGQTASAREQTAVANDPSETSSLLDNYGIAFGIVALLNLLIAGVAGWRCLRLFTRRTNLVQAETSRATVIALCLHAIAIICFFFVPQLAWIQILFLMAVVDMLEELSVRPAIIGRLSREQE